MRHVALALLVATGLLATPQAQVVTDRNRQDALRHYGAGEQALRREAFADAEREFQLAVRLDPTLDLAYYGLGQTYMATKRYSLAVRSYLNCRETFTNNASSALGSEAVRQQRIDDRIRALEDTKRGYETGVGNNQTANTPATIQRLQMQINGLNSQRHRTEDVPQSVPAWISLALGSAYFRTDAMADAEREFREALKVEPKLGEAHNNLAIVLMVTGRYREADQELKAAEGAGFKVNPQLKEDLKRALAGK